MNDGPEEWLPNIGLRHGHGDRASVWHRSSVVCENIPRSDRPERGLRAHSARCNVPLSSAWRLLALLRPERYAKNTAILTTIIFAGGLVGGRLLSFAVDGFPSPLLIFYAALECAVIPLAWWVYKQPE
jgi:hypothetical protein